MRADSVLKVSLSPRSAAINTVLTSTSSENSDVYLGYTGWSAGAFPPSYELDGVPTQEGDKWTNKPLIQACIVDTFH